MDGTGHVCAAFPLLCFYHTACRLAGFFQFVSKMELLKKKWKERLRIDQGNLKVWSPIELDIQFNLHVLGRGYSTGHRGKIFFPVGSSSGLLSFSLELFFWGEGRGSFPCFPPKIATVVLLLSRDLAGESPKFRGSREC